MSGIQCTVVGGLGAPSIRRLVAVAIAAAAASAMLCASLSARPAGQIPQFRGRIDLVNVGVTVTDRKSNLVSGLTADDFEILEEGKPQTVRFFAAGDADAADRPPMHLGLLIDVSESMGDDLAFSKTAAVKFLNTLTDAVDITVVDFDTEIRTARYSQNEYARLIERIRQKKASGDTALYDAIGTYLDGAAEEDGRKVMLLYTDGGDTRSAIGLTELMDLLKASDVTVYAIGELEHQSAISRNQQRMIIQQIAEVTGGRAFFPTAVKELDSVYEKVLAEIRAQYTLGYVSSNEKTDGKWRKVDVRMKRADLRARARRGYFAPLRK
ncbi:MAG TPA: VWA domain-containing protein [Vicinamibacterales bacterium]|nr:VWA domain-containing protein [Vicinamibacterales bacterium]